MFSDYSKGFGGKYGVQTDRVDKSAVGYDHQEKLGQHESQQGNIYIYALICYTPCNQSLESIWLSFGPSIG